MNFLKLLAEAVTSGRRVPDDASAPATGGAPPSVFPSKDGFLQRIIAAGIPVSEIVDVGVREGTFELIANFPRHRHHLFEPAKHCYGDIAQAYRDAQRMKGEGDAKASAIYARAYEQNPEFYAFYRSLEAYRQSFKNKSDVMVLDPNSEFFKYFKNGKPQK